MKKIVSSFAAFGISLLSVIPLTSAATPHSCSNSSEVIAGWTEGYTPLDEKYYPLFDYPEDYKFCLRNPTMYIDDVGCTVLRICPRDRVDEYVTLADGISVSQANALLKKRFPNFGNNPPYLTEKETLSDGTVSYEMICSIDGFDKAACSYLKENGAISGYIRKTGFYELQDVYCYRVLNYDTAIDYIGEETYNEIVAYIEEKNIGRLGLGHNEFDGDEDVEQIVVYDNITLDEQLDTALEIYEKFNVTPNRVSPLGANEMSPGNTIDLYNAVDGDANEDGVVDIADATLILQAIGNPDKYGLTPQGEYNADVNCSGGVTALDALEIQKINAGLR